MADESRRVATGSLPDEFRSLVPVESFDGVYDREITGETFFGYPLESIVDAERRLRSPDVRSVAFFSMEYGLSTSVYQPFVSVRPISSANFFNRHYAFSNMRTIDYYLSIQVDKRLDLPIYSGGLGVLAGDVLKSAADLGISLVGIGILWRRGYFKQNFWFKDGQVPEEMYWDPTTYPGLVPLTHRVRLALRHDEISVRLWKYYVYSYDRRHAVPLVLLDADLPENPPDVRRLTHQLYRSDNHWWKIMQRVVLGLGGIEALNVLGYSIGCYHLNEGHAALAFIGRSLSLEPAQRESLQRQFVYTCHTPVAAGHDRFPKASLATIVPDPTLALLTQYGADPAYPGIINFTHLAMTASRQINAVSRKHGEITRAQFPAFADRIATVTNGVHHHTWLSEPMARLLDRYAEWIGPWRQDPTVLRRVADLRGDAAFRTALWQAHQENKAALSALLEKWRIRPHVFTVAWARRIATYKRPSLILHDVERLLAIVRDVGQVQILLAGKAHPNDNLGFTHIDEMMRRIDALGEQQEVLRIVMLENYDTYFAELLTSGADLWLNNPLPPFEASGTSGMKAILNGVVQMSTLDGWMVEGASHDLGWIFGWRHEGPEIGSEGNLRLAEDARALYGALAEAAALYYRTNRDGTLDPASPWIDKMINCLSAAGLFSAHRMVTEYLTKIWNL